MTSQPHYYHAVSETSGFVMSRVRLRYCCLLAWLAAGMRECLKSRQILSWPLRAGVRTKKSPVERDFQFTVSGWDNQITEHTVESTERFSVRDSAA